MTSFSWAATLFGARQIQNLLLADSGRAAAAFETLADASGARLGAGLERVWRAGERWQSTLLDRVPFPSGSLLARGLGVVARTAPALGAVPGQSWGARELANKVEVWSDFQHAEERLGVAGSPLATAVAAALERGAFRRLWLIEGIGFAHAERRSAQVDTPRGLLRGGALEPRAEIPLHTGMGLSLAMRALGAIDTRGGERRLAAALARFDTACRDNAAPGCEAMAFEALGLVVRTLYPHLLQRVDRLLAADDPERLGRYWHGVGRALYFLPTHAVPGLAAWRRGLEKAALEPRHDAGRGNALAGFAWALTLVNLRHPGVVQSLLEPTADAIFDPAAFADGVSSALLLWHRSNGRDALLEAFLEPPAEPAAAERWQRWIGTPAAAALAAAERRAPTGGFGTLFRYRALGDRPAAIRGARRTPCCAPLPLAMSQGVDGWLSRAVQTLSR